MRPYRAAIGFHWAAKAVLYLVASASGVIGGLVAGVAGVVGDAALGDLVVRPLGVRLVGGDRRLPGLGEVAEQGGRQRGAARHGGEAGEQRLAVSSRRRRRPSGRSSGWARSSLTSLAASMIAVRSETLCDSIVATLVAACCSVTAGADGGVVADAADADVAGLAGTGPPEVGPPAAGPADDPPGAAGLGARGLAEGRVAERVRDKQPRHPAADEKHEQDDPQGQGRAGAATVMPAGRLPRRPWRRSPRRRRHRRLVRAEGLEVLRGLRTLLVRRALVGGRRVRGAGPGCGRADCPGPGCAEPGCEGRAAPAASPAGAGPPAAGPGRRAASRSRPTRADGGAKLAAPRPVNPGPSPGPGPGPPGAGPPAAGHRERAPARRDPPAARTSGRTAH